MTISYEKPDDAGVSYQDEGRVPRDIIRPSLDVDGPLFRIAEGSDKPVGDMGRVMIITTP
ncbi:hypothetical protein [Rhizorhabdus histidinilytica]|uniref:hypothetical protein n=1 Tax=Rhizorhabdus histidinilytica TaxID=439228 RepID=UPI0032201EDA